MDKSWPFDISEGNRGMFATQSINEGEVIGFIPRPMMFTYKEATKNCAIAAKNAKVKALIDDYLHSKIPPDIVMLMLFIMQEKRNPFSEWYHWTKTLPMDFSNHLINLDEK